MGPRGGVVTQRSAKARTPVQFRAWPPSIESGAWRRMFENPSKVPAKLAGGVPAVGERDQRPSRRVVIGSFGRHADERRLVGRKSHEILLRDRRNGRLHGIQQSVEFSFAHRALPPWVAQRRKTGLFPNFADRSNFIDPAIAAYLVTDLLRFAAGNLGGRTERPVSEKSH